MRLVVHTATENIEYDVPDAFAARAIVENLNHDDMEPIDATLIIDGVKHAYDFRKLQFNPRTRPMRPDYDTAARLNDLLDAKVEASEAQGCGKASSDDVLRMAREIAEAAGCTATMDDEGNVEWKL